MSVSRESTHSIVLALELEHQLANEDHELSPIKEAMSTATITGAADLPPLTDGEQYDPEILSSIVVQLRATLARVTQERDESNEALVEAGNKNATLEARAADLTELLEAETERSAKLEAERDQAIKTAQEAEEQVCLGCLSSAKEKDLLWSAPEAPRVLLEASGGFQSLSEPLRLLWSKSPFICILQMLFNRSQMLHDCC